MSLLTHTNQLLTAVVISSCLISGCGSAAFTAADTTVNLAGEGLSLAYHSFSAAYAAAAEKALEESRTPLEFESRMKDYDEVGRILALAQMMYERAKIALDIWDSTDDPAQFLSSAPCLLEALVLLQDGLNLVGIHSVDSAFETVSDLARQVIGGRSCGQL